MIRRSTKLVALVLLAGAAAQSLLAAPAAAGGRVSWSFAPSDRDTAAALGTGLRLYSLYEGIRGSGGIRQRGRGNAAGLAQAGRGNLGLVEQRGEGHAATLSQAGERNAYGLFQFGRGTEDHVVQEGADGSGATVSYGW